MARTTRLSLDLLPAEILQHIADLGTCEAAIALIKTNRKLHDACDDIHVFRSILENGNGLRVEDWQCAALKKDSPLTHWKGYALADQRGWELQHVREQPARQLRLWLPQLCALNHPLIKQRRPLQSPSEGNMVDVDTVIPNPDWVARGFCDSVICLSIPPSVALSGSLSDQGGLSGPLLAHIDEQMTSKEEISHAFATAFIQTFASQLKHSIERNEVHRLGFQPVPRREQPPAMSSIPFPTFMSLPPPFSKDAGRRFAACHLPTMLSPAFLSSGSWTGYYTYASRTGHPRRFDPAMTDIRFRVTHDGPLDMFIESDSGVDGIGTFRLSGRIDKESGRMRMFKQYTSGGPHRWSWDVLMTPFGIFGGWGQSSRYIGSYVWLWKDEWTENTLINLRSS